MDLTLTITGLSPSQLEEVGKYAESITNADAVLGPVDERMAAPTPQVMAPAPAVLPIVAPAELPAVAQHVPQTDANGMPWDSRIHVKTKRQNKDLTWTYRRGLDPAIITTVEAELSGGVITDTDHITPEVIEQPAVDPAAILGAPPAAAVVEQPAVAQVNSDDPVAAMGALLGKLAAVTTADANGVKQLSQGELDAMNNQFNITNVMELAGDATRIAQADMYLDMIVGNKG